jgi:hypothetical protein
MNNARDDRQGRKQHAKQALQTASWSSSRYQSADIPGGDAAHWRLVGSFTGLTSPLTQLMVVALKVPGGKSTGSPCSGSLGANAAETIRCASVWTPAGAGNPDEISPAHFLFVRAGPACGGPGSIDYPSGSHDAGINAVAEALVGSLAWRRCVRQQLASGRWLRQYAARSRPRRGLVYLRPTRPRPAHCCLVGRVVSSVLGSLRRFYGGPLP